MDGGGRGAARPEQRPSAIPTPSKQSGDFPARFRIVVIMPMSDVGPSWPPISPLLSGYPPGGSQGEGIMEMQGTCLVVTTRKYHWHLV